MYKTIHDSLNHWYVNHGRHHLPWRGTSDPYAIWISEIMLQQTQVKTVLERFYFPFLEAFPTVDDLASASLDDVLKKWEGLGYYTRARNLHAAAIQASLSFPKNAAEFQRLPGIGRSTAHAIAAFAFQEPLPILDANVKRILHRFFALKERDEKKLWEKAYRFFDSSRPFEFNQAMMDLGSMICLPKTPLCDQCPLIEQCKGKESPLEYPSPKNKLPKRVRTPAILVYTRNDRYALAQRKSRFLSGLWGFYESTEPLPSAAEHLGDITQHYSHFTLNASVFEISGDVPSEEFEWFALEEITDLSLSRADHKVVELIRYNRKKEKEDTCSGK
ncbi:MAG: A/G-specific adenine glycosylase [Sulfuricurvum sp.]